MIHYHNSSNQISHSKVCDSSPYLSLTLYSDLFQADTHHMHIPQSINPLTLWQTQHLLRRRRRRPTLFYNKQQQQLWKNNGANHSINLVNCNAHNTSNYILRACHLINLKKNTCKRSAQTQISSTRVLSPDSQTRTNSKTVVFSEQHNVAQVLEWSTTDIYIYMYIKVQCGWSP